MLYLNPIPLPRVSLNPGSGDIKVDGKPKRDVPEVAGTDVVYGCDG